jgi:Tfp pilus assembly protein PilO
MQPREKLLASAVGVLLALLVTYWLFGKVRRAFSERYALIEVREGEIREKDSRVQRGNKAKAQLAHWEHRSLPSDQDLARTLYQNWLVKLVHENKLGNVSVSAGRGGMHRNTYYNIPFSVQCKGTLEQMVAFLHDFYSTNHLHQLRELSIKPSSSARSLDLNFTIEALVLPGADRKDALNEEPGDRLMHATLAAYSEPIVKRNLFAEYVPPQPPRPQVAREQPPPAFDPAKFAVLTGITEDGVNTHAWINVRTSGELLKLRKGDKIKVGEFEATITRIDASSIELDNDGKRRWLSLGKTLPQAVEAGQ